MTNDFTPLESGEPRTERLGGMKGGSRKTRFYREQLKANPGKWFVWKRGSKYASDTSGALRTLTGFNSLSGMDRQTLEFEATAQKQDDGLYTTFVRARNADDIVESTDGLTPLDERVDASAVTTNVMSVSNPFGVNN